MPALKRSASNAGANPKPLKRTKSTRAVPVYSVPRSIGTRATLLPQKMVAKSCYVRLFNLNPGINTVSSATFKCNDLTAPESSVPGASTGAGAHQPIGFDQMAQLYVNYKVLSAKITVQATAENATATTAPMYITLQKHENAAYSPNDVGLILERGLSQYKVLGLADSGASTVRLTDTYRLSREQPDRKDSQGVLGTSQASPESEALYYFSVAACPSDGSNDPSIARIMVRIDYTIEWSSPIQINQS